MICAAHQVHFLPYLGFFDKLMKSDVFILVDDFQYVKQGHQNRNYIKTSEGALWLTISVSNFNQGDMIKDIKVSNHDFIKQHLGAIRGAYAKTKYFNTYFLDIEKLYLSCVNKEKLSEISMIFLNYFIKILETETKIVHIKDLNVVPADEPTQRIANMCKAVGADTYLSGDGAKDYLLPDVLEENGINLKWQNFKHPIYEQKWGEFLPNMCILDALFNIGPELKNIIGK